MSNLFWLTDEQVERLRPFFPKSHGKPRVDDRRVLSGIIFINRNGLRWCDAPKEDGPPKTLHNPLETMERQWHLRPDDGWPGRRGSRSEYGVPLRRSPRCIRLVLAMIPERALTLAPLTGPIGYRGVLGRATSFAPSSSGPRP
jgi:hypothetical protein